MRRGTGDSRGPVTLVKEIFLRICKLNHILKDPFLQLGFELTYFKLLGEDASPQPKQTNNKTLISTISASCYTLNL